MTSAGCGRWGAFSGIQIDAPTPRRGECDNMGRRPRLFLQDGPRLYISVLYKKREKNPRMDIRQETLQDANAVIARLEDPCWVRRRRTLERLCELEPATLAQHAEAVVARLKDSEWTVRLHALRTLGKLEPVTLAQHADAVVAMLEDSEVNGRYWVLKTLGKLEPATLAQYASAVVARFEDSEECVREAALRTLGHLEPATLAQHASAVVAMLENSVGHGRYWAMKTLGKLEPATLAQYASAVVARFEDSEECVREAAMMTLAELEPATLALHADSVVAMLGDQIRWRDKVGPPAFEVIRKLEPAALAQHAYALLPIFEANSHFPLWRDNAKSILRRGLPRFVRHGIDFDDKDMAFYDLSRRLLGRLGWYKLRLRLHAQRLALYWYALPYRPSGPGHARDVEAWGRIGISSKRSRSD